VSGAVATGNNWVVRKMKPEEVMAMTDDELRTIAWELIGGCWGEDAPDYPNDIAAAWELMRALPEDMTMTIYTGRMVILEQSEMYELAGGGIAAPLYSEIARFIGDSDERNITKAFIIAMGEKK